VRTPISAVVLAVLLVAGCASQPTSSAAGSSPPIASLVSGSSAASTPPSSPVASGTALVSAPPVSGPASEPVSSSRAARPPVSSAPTSDSPDPCLAPLVENAGPVPLLALGADSLVVCHPGAVAGRAGPVTLSGNDATNIGKLLDLAPQGTATCLYKPDVWLRFEFRGAPAHYEDLEISTVGCDHPIATAGGHTWLISQQLADFLSADAIAPGAKQSSPPIPDVTGLSLTEATQVIARAGMTVATYSDDRVTDPLLSPNTVVLQDPPAGAGMIGSTTEVDVLLSQLPAPACSLGELAFDYRGVQYGTGNAFSDLDVRDITATPCTLIGPISVVGVDAGGRDVTNRLTLPVAGDLVLSADAPPRAVDGSAAKNVVMAWIPLEADVRDGPDANGSCTNHLVLPKTWDVTVAGGQRFVPNGAGTAEPPMNACQGNLDVAVPPSTITALN
jgi:PASTA domain